MLNHATTHSRDRCSQLKKMKKETIPAINFHIWKYCNFKCKFCFATYEDENSLYRQKSYLSEKEMLGIIDEISKQGIGKITFAGGEPMLCKWLPNLIKHAKEVGLTTMIVTNGYLLTEKWIKEQSSDLDWITLSIDSIDAENQLNIGRSNGKKVVSRDEYLQKVEAIKRNGIRFKLNTVVCSSNSLEDISDFVISIKPERWKIFQVLPISRQNDNYIEEFLISSNEFKSYINRHKRVEEFNIKIVPEDNNLMTGSYLMIDPQGRFYDNLEGKYRYSDPILKVGFEKARQQVTVRKEKFTERKGLYNW